MAKHGVSDEHIVMRVTGCPNGCGRAMLAEVGLVGKAPGRYNLMLGGDARGQRLNTLYRENIDEAAYVCHTISALGRKGVTDDFIVPEIHVKRQFIVDAFHVESRHVAHNALQRSVYLHLAQEQIGVYSIGFTRLLIPVMF